MVTKTRTRRKAKAPPMTAGEAKSFDRYSAGNAGMAVLGRDCNCKPYVDIFTYRRWQAQGMQVRKGERGSHLAILKDVSKLDKDGEPTVKTIRTGTSVFCRCQVSPVDASTWFTGMPEAQAAKVRAANKAARAPQPERTTPPARDIMEGWSQV